MPAQSVWMIRLSLFYLLVAVVLGAVLLTHKAMPLHPAVWGMLSVHYEMAVWGWLVQFVMGTAYWMFPRNLEDKGRGSAGLAWAVVAAMNAGTWLLATSVISGAVAAVAGRVSIALGVFMFAGLMWNRVVSYRSRT